MISLSTAFKRLFRMGPSVSVIVPIYNKANFLRECLKSIAEQTFTDIEVICIDDCSSDGSPSIASEFAQMDSRFKLFRSKNSLGAGPARNKGMDLASGKFLQFTDADDILPANSIETLYRLVSNGKVNIARGGVALFDRNGISSIINSDIPPEVHSYRFADEPRLWNPWWHTTYLISGRMLRRHHILYPDLSDGEDPVFLAKALTTANLISSTKEIVYFYRWEIDRPRTAIWDTITHLEMVRLIYIQYEPKCWFEGYGKFMIKEEMPRRLSQMNLEPDVKKTVLAKLEELIMPLE
jgi:glycosyltransferase involved in cell wall biosynthesis